MGRLAICSHGIIQPFVSCQGSSRPSRAARRTLITVATWIERAMIVDPHVCRLIRRCKRSHLGLANYDGSKGDELTHIVGTTILRSLKSGVRQTAQGCLDAFQMVAIFETDPQACKRFFLREGEIQPTRHCNTLSNATSSDAVEWKESCRHVIYCCHRRLKPTCQELPHLRAPWV